MALTEVNLTFVEALLNAGNISLSDPPGSAIPSAAYALPLGRDYDLALDKTWNISVTSLDITSSAASYRCDHSVLGNHTISCSGNVTHATGTTVTGVPEIKPNPIPLVEMIIYSFLAGIASIVTIVGNLIVILSFILERSIRQPSNYFICSLACSDLLIGCFSMPLYTVYLVMGKYWPMGEVVCDLWLSTDYQVCLTSIYTVFFITVDRYCSVKIPAKYRNWRTDRKVKIMVATTWVIPILLFFTSIIGWQFFVGKRTVLKGHCYVQFMEDGIFNAVLVICYYWVTLVVICILYTGIYQVALNLQRRSEAKHKKMSMLVSMAGQTATRIGIGACKSNQHQPSVVDVPDAQNNPAIKATLTTSFSAAKNNAAKSGDEHEEDRSSSPAFPSDSEPTPTEEPVKTFKQSPPRKKKRPKPSGGEKRKESNSKGYNMIPRVDIKDTAKRNSLPDHILTQVDGGCLFAPISPPLFAQSPKHSMFTNNGVKRKTSYAVGCNNGRGKQYSGDRLLPAVDLESASLMSDHGDFDVVREPTFTTFRESLSNHRVSSPELPVMPCPSPLPVRGAENEPKEDNDSLQSLCSTEHIADIPDNDLDIHVPKCGIGENEEERVTTNAYEYPPHSPDSPVWKRRSAYTFHDSETGEDINYPQYSASHGVPPSSPERVKIDDFEDDQLVTRLPIPDEVEHLNAENSYASSCKSPKPSPKRTEPPPRPQSVPNQPKQTKQKSKSEIRGRKALRTITFILGAFVLCWTPYHILVLIVGFCRTDDCLNITLYDISYFMCYMNSPINPLCYALANAQFKKTFLRILRFDWHRT